MTGRRSSRGSAVPFAISSLGLLLLVGAALGVVGSIFTRHRAAQAAADLGSLSAVTALQRGDDACAAAGDAVAANGARLLGCRVDRVTVTVTVSVPGPRWLGQRGDPTATARAGPAP